MNKLQVFLDFRNRSYDQFNQMRIKQSDKLDGDFEKIIKKISANRDNSRGSI